MNAALQPARCRRRGMGGIRRPDAAKAPVGPPRRAQLLPFQPLVWGLERALNVEDVAHSIEASSAAGATPISGARRAASTGTARGLLTEGERIALTPLPPPAWTDFRAIRTQQGC
jgi:hypothetical protein